MEIQIDNLERKITGNEQGTVLNKLLKPIIFLSFFTATYLGLGNLNLANQQKVQYIEENVNNVNTTEDSNDVFRQNKSFVYTVKKGDYLEKLLYKFYQGYIPDINIGGVKITKKDLRIKASRFNDYLTLIRRINGIKDLNKIRYGKKITIAPPREKKPEYYEMKLAILNGLSSLLEGDNFRMTSDLMVPRESSYGGGNSRDHKGIDFGNKKDSKVYPFKTGRVIFTGDWGTYGKTVLIEHGDGYKTLYSHLSKITTRYGEIVKKHQQIGVIGKTGKARATNLHFEVINRDNARVNPYIYVWYDIQGLLH